MANYFEIEPISISTSPFDTITVNAISWSVMGYYRHAANADCICIMHSLSGNSLSAPLYTWRISLPNDILSRWLDDSVVDDYICTTDVRFIKR